MPKQLKCPFCESHQIVENGKSGNIQRAKCKACNKYFRTRYQKKAYKKDTQKRIEKLLDGGSSIRAIASKLKISSTTVLKYKHQLEKSYQERINQPYRIPKNVIHTVLWSGGKDSSALLIWALEHLPKDKLKFIFCDTGWESPLTYQFIDRVNKELLQGKLIVLKSKKYSSLSELARHKKRFPSVKARFCTEQLKIVPMIEWILEQTEDFAVYQGIRAEESLNRSRMKQSDDYFKPQLLYQQDPYKLIDGKRVRKHSPVYYRKVINWLNIYDCSVERPLFYWKEKDIIKLCKKYNVLNPLYEMGFNRVGCFPCIMESKAGIKILAEQFPERISEIATLERDINSSFFGYDKVPGTQCKYPTINDVVKWSMGNKTSLEHSNSPCISHYQVCE